MIPAAEIAGHLLAAAVVGSASGTACPVGLGSASLLALFTAFGTAGAAIYGYRRGFSDGRNSRPEP